MIYGAIFTVSLIYALILYHLSRTCRPCLVDHLAWFALIWLGYVAVGLKYLVPEAWLKVAGLLAVSLGPMIIAHLVASYQRGQRLVEYLRSRGQNDRAETMARACGQPADGGDC